MIEDRLSHPVTTFAAPYGHTTPRLREAIAESYACAVGTRMAKTSAASDRYDLPRIDMWYFRNRDRWRAYVDGSTTYFTMRQMLRRVRITARVGSGMR